MPSTAGSSMVITTNAVMAGVAPAAIGPSTGVRSWRALGLVHLVVWGLADPGLLAQVAVGAERAGWDGVFVWDHLWNRTLVPFADPFVTLAAIAMATERVVIGTMVTALPRRRPQLVAQSTTSVDRLSNGRMVLGLGLGVDSHGEYSVFDEPAADDRARAAALDAGIKVLTQMLAGEPVDRGRTGDHAGQRSAASRSDLDRRPGRAHCRPTPSPPPRLEGLALVDADVWRPEHVTTALRAGDRRPAKSRSFWSGARIPMLRP